MKIDLALEEAGEESSIIIQGHGHDDDAAIHNKIGDELLTSNSFVYPSHGFHSFCCLLHRGATGGGAGGAHPLPPEFHTLTGNVSK